MAKKKKVFYVDTIGGGRYTVEADNFTHAARIILIATTARVTRITRKRD